MIEAVVKLLTGLISILPASPFTSLLKTIDGLSALNFLNWFVPFDIFIVLMESWLTCMAIWYVYKTVSTKVNKL